MKFLTDYASINAWENSSLSKIKNTPTLFRGYLLQVWAVWQRPQY